MIKFKGRHFPKDLILMAERGTSLEYSTVQKWVVYYASQLEEAFRKRKKPVGKSWKMDETYIQVRGKWCYLYRVSFR